MKKFFKIFNSYQTIVDRIDHYATFKHILLSIIVSMAAMVLPVFIFIFLISLIWDYTFLVYVLSILSIVLAVYAYFLLYFYVLRRLVPKIKEVKINVVFWVESSVAILILLTVVVIFITQLRK